MPGVSRKESVASMYYKKQFHNTKSTVGYSDTEATLHAFH